MRRLGKWILIAFVLVVGAVVLLFILDPAGTVLLAGVILAPLFWNSGPPPIAEGLTAGGEEGDRKLTAVLERRFPNGTREVDLKSALLRQGFHPVPPPPADCLLPGQDAPIGVVYSTC